MLSFKSRIILFAAGLLVVGALPVHAGVIISEVDAAGSASGSGYGADWFELTNTGTSAVNTTGWRMDDSSDMFSLSVGLSGVTTINPGQSAVFIETTGGTAATIISNFETAWFGSNVPSGFTIGTYAGNGVGLSQTSDAVNIFDSTGNPQAGVTFGMSTLGATFDNAAGVNGAISTFSVAGVNGAFLSASGVETGSPGSIASVPEPSTIALIAVAAVALLARAGRRRSLSEG